VALKTLALAIVGTAVALASALPSAQKASSTPTASDKVIINGWALSMSNVATGKNQSIQITINRWSSPAPREQLIETFLEKKQDGLRRALEKQAHRVVRIGSHIPRTVETSELRLYRVPIH
jgi:hypothetical protein